MNNIKKISFSHFIAPILAMIIFASFFAPFKFDKRASVFGEVPSGFGVVNDATLAATPLGMAVEDAFKRGYERLEAKGYNVGVAASSNNGKVTSQNNHLRYFLSNGQFAQMVYDPLSDMAYPLLSSFASKWSKPISGSSDLARNEYGQPVGDPFEYGGKVYQNFAKACMSAEGTIASPPAESAITVTAGQNYDESGNLSPINNSHFGARIYFNPGNSDLFTILNRLSGFAAPDNINTLKTMTLHKLSKAFYDKYNELAEEGIEIGDEVTDEFVRWVDKKGISIPLKNSNSTADKSAIAWPSAGKNIDSFLTYNVSNGNVVRVKDKFAEAFSQNQLGAALGEEFVINNPSSELNGVRVQNFELGYVAIDSEGEASTVFGKSVSQSGGSIITSIRFIDSAVTLLKGTSKTLNVKVLPAAYNIEEIGFRVFELSAVKNGNDFVYTKGAEIKENLPISYYLNRITGELEGNCIFQIYSKNDASVYSEIRVFVRDEDVKVTAIDVSSSMLIKGDSKTFNDLKLVSNDSFGALPLDTHVVITSITNNTNLRFKDNNVMLRAGKNYGKGTVNFGLKNSAGEAIGTVSASCDITLVPKYVGEFGQSVSNLSWYSSSNNASYSQKFVEAYIRLAESGIDFGQATDSSDRIREWNGVMIHEFRGGDIKELSFGRVHALLIISGNGNNAYPVFDTVLAHSGFSGVGYPISDKFRVASDGDYYYQNYSQGYYKLGVDAADSSFAIGKSIDSQGIVRESGMPVAISSINILKSKTAIVAGQSEELQFVNQPFGSSGEIVWSSSNSSVATVTDGVVNALSSGSAIITASCNDASDTINVTVVNDALKASKVEFKNKTIYTSQEFMLGYDDFIFNGGDSYPTDTAFRLDVVNKNGQALSQTELLFAGIKIRSDGLTIAKNSYAAYSSAYLKITMLQANGENEVSDIAHICFMPSQVGSISGSFDEVSWFNQNDANVYSQRFKKAYAQIMEAGVFDFGIPSAVKQIDGMLVQEFTGGDFSVETDEKTVGYLIIADANSDAIMYDDRMIAKFGGIDLTNMPLKNEYISINGNLFVNTTKGLLIYTQDGSTFKEGRRIENNGKLYDMSNNDITFSGFNVSAENNKTSLAVGESVNLLVSYIGEPLFEGYTLSVSNSSIATLNGQKLTAKSTGTVTITATSTFDTSITKSITITIVSDTQSDATGDESGCGTVAFDDKNIGALIALSAMSLLACVIVIQKKSSNC